ncbi:MAG: hypothetical protein UY76_C0034G0005 [Candidatus Uhrbacteria bacterium GW2011_GWA2_52_8d]|uniref:Uncharacterized protein n=1 Tax=Candidatus Uhrbacteria bacterium GW2011_GWA2_52_8d TaxID=1618979 RepID=A0A0G1XLW1_9BACT|nr:MAG: hypothetical protein UY76_C0034G0005 [Candidatus Uhrbacteria bacterium GW2011_GWA2_52_8d]
MTIALESLTTLDENPLFRASSRSHKNRCGRRKPKRTRTGNHENRHGWDEGSCHVPREDEPNGKRHRGKDDHNRHEDAGDFVDELLDGSLLLLSLLDHLHDLRQDRIAREGRHLHGQCSLLVNSRAEHRIAFAFPYRHALSREHRFIQ